MSHYRDAYGQRIQQTRRIDAHAAPVEDARDVAARSPRGCLWPDGALVSLRDHSGVVGFVKPCSNRDGSRNARITIRRSSDPAFRVGDDAGWWNARPWVIGLGPDLLRCPACRRDFRGQRQRGGRELCRSCEGDEFETVHDGRQAMTTPPRTAQQMADDDEFPNPF